MFDHIKQPSASSITKAEAVKRKRGTSKTEAAAFAEALAEAENDATQPSSINMTGVVAPLVFGQDQPSQDQAEEQRGEAILARLDRLRHMLLTGSISTTELHEIERLVAASRHSSASPHLAMIMEEIDTRAKVELAKLEKLR